MIDRVSREALLQPALSLATYREAEYLLGSLNYSVRI